MNDIETRVLIIETENKRRDIDIHSNASNIGSLNNDFAAKGTFMESKLASIILDTEKRFTLLQQSLENMINKKMIQYLTGTGIIVGIAGTVITIVVISVLRKS